MKKIFLLVLCSCEVLQVNGQQYSNPEKIMIARLRWLYQVKDFAADQSWPGFAGIQNETALAYFTDSSSYIIDPGKQLQQRVAAIPWYHKNNHPILKTAQRIDDRPFHMETAMDTKDSTVLYYNYPVMMCSDFESARSRIADLGSLQEWASMVIHEYFHGFQFRHPTLTAYGNDSVSLRGSQLQAFYDRYEWFKTSLDQENKILLACLEMTDIRKTEAALKIFCTLREQRRCRLEDSLHNNFAPQEDFYEKLEGSAKYVELGLLAAYKLLPADDELRQLDTAYKDETYRHFNIKAEKWRYSTGSVSYFYATGYNLLRVLDKLNVTYKKDFFSDNTTTPYGLIKTYLQRR